MSHQVAGMFVVIGLSAVGVVADMLLKRASQTTSPISTGWFIAGLVTYASTAFGWVYALRTLHLASIGVIYAASTVIMLAIAGVLCFGERLTLTEVIGAGLAIAAVWLTGRFG